MPRRPRRPPTGRPTTTTTRAPASRPGLAPTGGTLSQAWHASAGRRRLRAAAGRRRHRAGRHRERHRLRAWPRPTAPCCGPPTSARPSRSPACPAVTSTRWASPAPWPTTRPPVACSRSPRPPAARTRCTASTCSPATSRCSVTVDPPQGRPDRPPAAVRAHRAGRPGLRRLRRPGRRLRRLHRLRRVGHHRRHRPRRVRGADLARGRHLGARRRRSCRAARCSTRPATASRPAAVRRQRLGDRAVADADPRRRVRAVDLAAGQRRRPGPRLVQRGADRAVGVHRPASAAPAT